MDKIMKWIEFRETDKKTRTAKTRRWQITAKSGADLGYIAWSTSFRKYAFYPNPDTVFEEDCLRDIAQFIVDVTAEHRGK